MTPACRPIVGAASTAILIVGLGGCSDGTGVAAAGTEEPVLNIYNWSDYIADDTVAEFQRRTGIEVSDADGDTDPVANNASKDGQQKNRRCDLIVVPDVDEMIDLTKLTQ